jgi:methyltransferase, FkbM family
MFSHRLRKWIKSTSLRAGYEVRKAHPESYEGVKILSVLDLALRELLSRKGGGMTFVEIGANDGIDFDPLRPYIERYALRGVLVEPQPSVFERLKRNYEGIPSVTFENCAIGSTEGNLSLYYAQVDEKEQNFATTLASSNRSAIENYAKSVGGRVMEINVPCITPAALLKKHGFTQIDILQIDTEGMDFEILKAFDLERVRPEIIHYESGQLAPQEQEKSYRYLTGKGYEVLTQEGDTIAIPVRS